MSCMFSNLRINVFKLKTKKKLIEFTLFYVMLKLWSKQNFLQKKSFCFCQKEKLFLTFSNQMESFTNCRWQFHTTAFTSIHELILPWQTPPNTYRYWYKDKAYKEAGTSGNLGFRKAIKIY